MDTCRRLFRKGGKASMFPLSPIGTFDAAVYGVWPQPHRDIHTGRGTESVCLSRWSLGEIALAAGGLPPGHGPVALGTALTALNPIVDVSPRLGYVIKRYRFGGRLAAVIWTGKSQTNA